MVCFQEMYLSEEPPNMKRVRYQKVKPGDINYCVLISSISAQFFQSSFLAPAREQAQARAEEARYKKASIPRGALSVLDVALENEVWGQDAEGEGGGVDDRGGMPNTTTGHCAVLSTAERIEAYMARREEERQAKERRKDEKERRQMEEYHRHVEALEALLVRVRDQQYDWRTANNDVLKAALIVLPKATTPIDPELKVGTKAYLIAKLEGPMSDKLKQLHGGVEVEREEVYVSESDREPIDAA